IHNQRTSRDLMPKGETVQELHGDKRTIFVPPDLVNRADIRMVQCGSSTGLTTEALQRLGVLSHTVGKKLQRNEAAEFQVFGLVDDAHSATAESFENTVVRDGLPDHWAGILGLGVGQVNEGVRFLMGPSQTIPAREGKSCLQASNPSQPTPSASAYAGSSFPQQYPQARPSCPDRRPAGIPASQNKVRKDGRRKEPGTHNECCSHQKCNP